MPVTIALVDDDRNILTSVSIALQQEGFVTRVYSDPILALKAINDNPPDLGVFDIKMPGMDGMELLRRVREFSSMPVIFLTSKDDELDEALGLAMGLSRILGTGRDVELLKRVKALAPDRIEVIALGERSTGEWAKVMTGGEGADRLDPPRLGGTRRNGPDMNDLFAFFPRDLCPVVRVRCVWQILVLLEFFPDRPEQIIGFDAFRLGRDDPFNGVFLRPRDNPLDQCAAGRGIWRHAGQHDRHAYIKQWSDTAHRHVDDWRQSLRRHGHRFRRGKFHHQRQRAARRWI